MTFATGLGFDAVPSIIEFVEGREYLDLDISPAQRVLLKAIYGLDLAADDGGVELDLFRRYTGRAAYVPQSYGEVSIIAGARSGKDSRIACPLALYEAIFGGHVIAKGETGVIPLFAQDAENTKTAYDYAHAYITRCVRLERFLNDDPAKRLVIESAQGFPMEVMCLPCTGRAVRGKSVPAAVMDEAAFFRTDGGKPLDKQVQDAIRRGMVGFKRGGRPRLVKISTPALGGRVGVMWQDYERYFGQEQGDVLVWHATTTQMNPSIGEAELAEDRRKNPLGARREFDAEFIAASDGGYVDLARVEACVVKTRPAALTPSSRWRYVAHVDPSGGGADEFTLAIGHTEDGVAVRIDYTAARVRQPGEPIELTGVVKDFADVIKRYQVATVKGDKFAGAWVEQEFRKNGVAYEKAERSKSELYRDAKPFFNEGRVELPDEPHLTGQLAGLDERTRPGGRVPTVDHPPGGHDDRANAVCGVIAELAASMSPVVAGTWEEFRDRAEADRVAEAQAQAPLGAEAVAAAASSWDPERAYAYDGPPARGRMTLFGRGARPGRMFR